jgi:hypothetical protein
MKLRFNVTGNVRLGLAVALAAALPLRAHDQPANCAPCPPPGDLLRPAADFSQWTEVYVYPTDPAKPGAPAVPSTLITRRVVTKTRQIVHEQLFNANGPALDRWFVDRVQYRRTGAGATWFQNQAESVDPGHNFQFDPLPPNGFRGLDWVTTQTYAGTVTFGGRPCLVYIPGGAKGINLASPAIMQDNFKALHDVLFVDAETRMPVEFRREGVTRDYQFASAPSGMQTLPDDLLAQMKAADAGRARLDLRAPLPY